MAKFILMQDPEECGKPFELFTDAKDVNSVAEVAQHFGVYERTVRNLIAKGELESIRIGTCVRVTKSAMLDFINQEVQDNA